MTKQQKNQIDNLYNFSKNNVYDEKQEKKKIKEREKRIKQRKKEQNDKFDFDTEVVIGMTNKNNQRKTQEIKKEITKKQEYIQKKKKRVKRIIKWTTLLLLIIGGCIFALVSPIFNIKQILVINNNQIPTETIVSLSQLKEGENLFRFNKNKVQQEIKTNAYVESVNIKRKVPNIVQITIKEREKKYNVEFLNGYAYINEQGYILEVSEQKLDLPVIQGISTEQEKIMEGNRLNIQDLEKLEVVIQIMNICKSYELDKKITSINIENNYVIYMEDEKKTIYLGDASNLSNKMLYIPTILSENQGKEGNIYIDKASENKFTARFREKV